MHLSTAEGRLHHVVGQRNAHRVNFKERSARPAGTYVHRLTDIHIRCPHCPEDNVSISISSSRTPSGPFPLFPTPKTTSATSHRLRDSKAEYFTALPTSRTTWQRPHLLHDSFKRPPSISSVRAAQNNQSNPNTANESDKTSQHKPPKSFTASTILP